MGNNRWTAGRRRDSSNVRQIGSAQGSCDSYRSCLASVGNGWAYITGRVFWIVSSASCFLGFTAEQRSLPASSSSTHSCKLLRVKSHTPWRVLLGLGGSEVAEAIDADLACLVSKEFASRVARGIRRSLVVLLIALGACLSGTVAAQTILTFPDPNLEAAIRSALMKPAGPISSVDLQSLRSLSAARKNIGNLSGLEWATNLSELYLSENAIVDLTPLKSLKGLARLGLDHNAITDLSSLARLTNLSSLDLGWNYVSNCPPLFSCARLSRVYLRGNSISDLSFVHNLKRLSFLNLDYNKISNLSPLAALTNLDYLSLSANSITNYVALSNLAGLINLELRGNSMSNLNFMSGLRRLSYADLAYNNVTDLSPLAGLTNLSNLVLAGN